jgi:tetratricopeptide (TPR) repeat protein
MRAEHRHELKQNALAEWLFNIPVWAKQNVRTITYVSAVVVIVLAYSLWYRYQKTVVSSREQTALTGLLAQLPQQKAQIAQAQAQGMDVSYALLQMANELDSLAGTSKKDDVAALALIKEAEILRTELHYRLGVVNQQDLISQITRAKDNYTKALDTYLKRSPNPELEAMAKLGLGLCEEELGNFDQAKAMYNEIAANSRFEGTSSAAAAKQRLATMDFFKQKITLPPGPKSAQAAVAEPNANETQTPAPQINIIPQTNAPGPNF